MLSIAARKHAADTAIPSWLTLAAARAILAARSGSSGQAREMPSIKICAPICVERLFPFVAAAPLAGGVRPFFRLMYAVCSAERPYPPHQKMDLFSIT